MILSVIVYNHKLTSGQWLGAAVVFAGISVEAWIKRRGNVPSSKILYTYVRTFFWKLSTYIVDVHAKRVMQEKEKAELKTL